CIRIPFGKGVCGAAAETLQVQRVDDVNAFPGHIACDAASARELVVPIVRDGKLIAVLDLDSPTPSRFTEEDEAGGGALCELLGRASALSCSRRSSLRPPGMIITGQGSFPESDPVKCATRGP